MLRSLVFVLLLVNAGFYAWSQGWLNDVVGVRPDAQREPQRLSQQVHPTSLIVLPPPTASSASTAAPSGPAVASAAFGASPNGSSPLSAASSCLEAGPFTEAEQSEVEAALKPVIPSRRWGTDTVTVQGSWMVYMGPYADAEALTRKRNELRRLRGLNFEEVTVPANLAPGLSLGRFDRVEEANAALDAIRLRGIRTARVVTLRPSMEQRVVRIPETDAALRSALSGLSLPQGKTFTACQL